MGILISAWLDIASKPWRTLAALAGMTAAVLAVVMVDAASVLSHSANDEYLARQFGLEVTYTLIAESGDDPLSRAQVTQALADNGFAVVSPDLGFTITVPEEGVISTYNGTWVSSQYDKIRIVDLVAGQWPRITADSGTPHLVVTQDMAERLGFTVEQVVGQTLSFVVGTGAQIDPQVDPVDLAIIDGVVTRSTNAISDADFLLVSDLAARWEILNPAPNFPGLLIRVNPADVGTLQEVVNMVKVDGSPVYSLSRSDQASLVAPVLDQQDVTSNAVKAVALTIGGLGILAAGLASVRERGTEYGIRRAFGASRWDIFRSVIFQTLIEVGIAAAIAIPLAAILVDLFSRRLVLSELPLPADTSLPLSSAVQGIIGALVVGLIAGLIPAVNAARTSVVQALRG